ncbi:MAG: hypothetical protein QOI91_1261 [Solirubrobacteraceae bacterium]|nr:hypothetical protein [Solirubrobacteraceae bacterium]MDX6670898.1 hypothetical protein [Solirubrobacteraceae bacterium]
MSRGPHRDVPTLIGGLAAIGVGVVLLLDRLDAIALTFGWLWPLLLAALGAWLLAGGLAQGRRR